MANKVRNKNKNDQKRYYETHEYDEFLLGTTGQYAPRTTVHEILFGSRKTYEAWNMISLNNDAPFWHHDRAHGIRQPAISKRELFLAKANLGHERPPLEVQREFDL